MEKAEEEGPTCEVKKMGWLMDEWVPGLPVGPTARLSPDEVCVRNSCCPWAMPVGNREATAGMGADATRGAEGLGCTDPVIEAESQRRRRKR